MNTLEKKYYVPFALVTSLFLLWGMANSMNDTLIAAFKRIMSMSDAQTSLIQCAFFGSYFCFALPAALFIRKFSYKAGIVLGLCLYALGTLLFYPASQVASYGFFLLALYVLASGCSILETVSNPYILSMGSPETATRRLNIAQSLNPVGSIAGILVAQYYILGRLSTESAAERASMDADTLASIQAGELSAITSTYMCIGLVLLVILCIMLAVKMPSAKLGESSARVKMSNSEAIRKLASNRKYVFGVLTQFAYVGAQTGVWSFTIRAVMQELGYVEKDAAFIFLISMLCFCTARFFFTWLMKYVKPSVLMVWAAVISAVLSLTVAFGAGSGWVVVAALVLISFFMSLMFPTIYGTALEGVGEEATLGASGLVMAILGGAVITPLQGLLSDATSIYTSYLVPAICFVIVGCYAVYASKSSK